ncbi:hypothetical protein L0F63_003882, partial [Massospora cicadina]
MVGKLDKTKVFEYHTRGFVILKEVLPQEVIQGFVDECDELINLVYREGKDLVTDFGCVLEEWVEPPAHNLGDAGRQRAEYNMMRYKVPFFNSQRITHAIVNILAPLAECILPEGNVYL